MTFLNKFLVYILKFFKEIGKIVKAYIHMNGLFFSLFSFASTLIVLGMLFAILIIILNGGLNRLFFNEQGHFNLTFFFEWPREANLEGGIFPVIIGTLLLTFLMILFALPLGVVTALYLNFYAGKNVFTRMIHVAANTLSGVPSIVFGLFGVAFFIDFLGKNIDNVIGASQPTWGSGGIFWASVTLAFLTLPVIIVSTTEALRTIPKDWYHGSVALGATRWQTIYKVFIPQALPGIISGAILAINRGAGEVAPLMFTGAVKSVDQLPLAPTHKFMDLGFHIYDLAFQSPDFQRAIPAAYATTTVLIFIVLFLNTIALIFRARFRRKQLQNR